MQRTRGPRATATPSAPCSGCGAADHRRPSAGLPRRRHTLECPTYAALDAAAAADRAWLAQPGPRRRWRALRPGEASPLAEVCEVQLALGARFRVLVDGSRPGVLVRLLVRDGRTVGGVADLDREAPAQARSLLASATGDER